MITPAHRNRLLTAAVGLPLVAAAVLLGGWWLFGVVAAVCALGLAEFYGLVWPRAGRGLAGAVGVGLGVALLFICRQGQWAMALGLLLGSFWLAGLAFLARASRDPERADLGSAMLLPAGLCYVPLALQFFLRFQPLEIALVLLVTFAADTGAFYAGSLIGGPKIWPSISPKKTWAGSLGGLAACAACCLAVGLALGNAPWWAWLALAAALNIAAQLGDFMESAIKRRLDVKDSGRLLPGHGGLLDRIDSLLFAVPVYAAARLLHDFFPATL